MTPTWGVWRFFFTRFDTATDLNGVWLAGRGINGRKCDSTTSNVRYANMSKIKRYLMELEESDMAGNFEFNVDPSISRPLTKKEIAFKKKFEYRVKTTSKYLGRNVNAGEFQAIHDTLTIELEEASE